MSKFRNEQEEFWSAEFGDEYIDRNKSDQLFASNLYFFSQALKRTRKINSCIEIGANVGMNLRALKLLFPQIHLEAVEINKEAGKLLIEFLSEKEVYLQSILDWNPQKKYDLVLSKGVLIHQNPDSLESIYKKLYEACNNYILLGEYYSPNPSSIDYRGHKDKLFKRDFAGELMEKYNDLILIDYGFSYRRDPNFPQDDISWFLLEKRK